MGIDYSANFGIGIKITESDVEEALGEENYVSEWDTMWQDYLYNLDEEDEDFKNKYKVINYGDSYDDDNYSAIVIKEPFAHGFDINSKVEGLKKKLEEIGFKDLSEVGVVGGLYIW
jgi:hypothetical protein